MAFDWLSSSSIRVLIVHQSFCLKRKGASARERFSVAVYLYLV